MDDGVTACKRHRCDTLHVSGIQGGGGRGGGGCRRLQGSEACVRLSAPFVAVARSEQGRGGPWGLRTLIYLRRVPSPSLRHRDDAPLPLLLGILVTQTQKRMKEEEEELKK